MAGNACDAMKTWIYNAMLGYENMEDWNQKRTYGKPTSKPLKSDFQVFLARHDLAHRECLSLRIEFYLILKLEVILCAAVSQSIFMKYYLGFMRLHT